ncbi:MAG TPA: cytochrome P450 [Cyclobacteriaceae bacterium]|nr:cytochrome P450 [Cyclobacteriaceae bacterium]
MAAEQLWSPFDPAHLSNPYSMYKRLRDNDPVHRSQTGEYIITRYNDIKSILKSSEYRSGNRLEWFSRGIKYFQNHDEDLSNIYKAINSFILFLNPPDHQQIRTFVSKNWDRNGVAETISGVADQLLTGLSGSFDLVKQFAQPMPAMVISKIMGIAIGDYEHLRKLGVTMTNSLNLYNSWKELVELNNASGEFVKYFGQLIEEKRKNPDDGLVSRLVEANDREPVIDEKQLISVLIFMFVSGEETTSHSIGTALHNLVQTGKYSHFGSNQDIARIAIEELFRFDSPVQLLGRISTRETQIGGITIPVESPLTLVTASANRDENIFDRPDELDLERSPNPHLAFGYGTHFCLGEWLGKLQVGIAIDRFVRKFPSAHIPTQNIVWNRNLSVRGMSSLIVNTGE